MSFADNLATFPNVENISTILITNSAGDAIDRIENAPGKQGSLKLYKALLEEFGELNAAAAKKGLELFAEHVADAEANPGKHPNIDRLFAIAQSEASLGLEVLEKE
jgi:hypothetical protein